VLDVLHELRDHEEDAQSIPSQKVLPQQGVVHKAETGWLSTATNTCFHRCCTVTDFRAATFNEEVIRAADRVKFCFC